MKKKIPFIRILFPIQFFSAFPVFSVRTEIVHDTCIVLFREQKKTTEEGAGALCDYEKKTSPVPEKKTIFFTRAQHVLAKEISIDM